LRNRGGNAFGPTPANALRRPENKGCPGFSSFAELAIDCGFYCLLDAFGPNDRRAERARGVSLRGRADRLSESRAVSRRTVGEGRCLGKQGR
jgi:hypothetical protein